MCDVLERAARTVNPRAVVWRGSGVATDREGVKILGTPVGHRTLLDRIPHVQDLQSAWLILLHCAATRANNQIRCVSPGGAAQFAHHHDEQIWECVCHILQLDPTDVEAGRELSTLPLSMGGLGLRSASRLRESAFWASWVDCLEMIRQRHPEVATQLVDQFGGVSRHPSLGGSSHGGQIVEWRHGFRTAFVARIGSRSPARTATGGG